MKTYQAYFHMLVGDKKQLRIVEVEDMSSPRAAIEMVKAEAAQFHLKPCGAIMVVEKGEK